MTRWQGRIPLLVGVAGHRQLDQREQSGLEGQVAAFFAELRALLPDTPIVVLSRLAGGADQLVASVALATGCESACLLPADTTTYRAAFAGEAAGAAFDRLLAASTILELPGATGAAVDPERAYAEAGYYLVRHATLLLVLWDGAASRRPGSVGDLARARSSGWLGGTDPTLCRLRVGSRGAPDPGAPALSARAAVEACGWRDADTFNAAVSAAGRPELADTPAPFSMVPDERVGDVAAVFRAASLRAAQIRTALMRRKVWLQGIAFLAAIAFAVFIRFGNRPWVLWLYLGLLAAALTVRTLIRYQGLHRRYLDCRCLAEGLRVAIYWRIAGVGGGADADYPVVGSIGGRDASLGWIGSAITALDGWMTRKPLPAGFDGCEFAMRHWLGSGAEQDSHAQIPYYQAAASHLRRIARRVDGVVSFTLITGVASAALLALLPAGWLGRAAPLLMAVMGFMPLISGTAGAAVDVPAELEMARQYEYMGRLLTQAVKRLAAAESDRERRQILFEAGAAALAEQRIWHAVVGQRAPGGRARS